MLGENTNNRVERAFGSMKRSIRESFTSSPTTDKAIVHLVNFCDERLNEAYTRAQFERLRIFDHDPEIKDINKEASKHLNDTGCIRLYTSLSLLTKRREKLSLSDDGVEEIFGEGPENEQRKVYDTSDMSCNCTFFVQHQCPCRHILFFRQSIQLPLFEKELFHERYYLERSEDLQDDLNNFSFNNNDEDDENDDQEDLEVIDDTLEQSEENVLNSNQKHNIIFLELLKISNLVASHGTKKFLDYVEEFRRIETIVRKGGRIFHQEMSRQVEDRQVEDREVVDRPVEDSLAESEVDFRTPQNDVTAEELGDTIPEDEYFSKAGPSHKDDSPPKYQLLFKKGLKARGRPKAPSSQVSFKKKTAVKRKTKEQKKQPNLTLEDSDAEPGDGEDASNSGDDLSESELDFSKSSDIGM